MVKVTIPKIQSAHGSDTRNIINAAIDLINAQGKSIQDLVAEGQLTPEQYATLIQTVNGLISKGNVTFDDIDINKGKLLPKHASEELLSMMTGNTPINAVPADGSITTNKLADGATNRSKLGDKYSFVGDVPSGADLKTVMKEGTHRAPANGNYLDFPEGLDKARNSVIKVVPINAAGSYIFQEIYQENDPTKRVIRLVNTATSTAGPYNKLWLTDSSIDRNKLSDFYSFVQNVPAGTDTKKLLKEGVHRLSANTNYIDLPAQLDSARNIIVTVTPINYTGVYVFQNMYQENDPSQHVSRMVNGNNNTAEPYKLIGKPTLEQTVITENSLTNFDRYGETTKPVVDDTLKLHYSAIKNIKIIGLDPSIPVKIWMVCRDFTTWNYRIMLGKYENGAWSLLADTGINFEVTENPNGPTDINFFSSGYEVHMRIDYNQLPNAGRMIDGSAVTDNPTFTVNSRNVMLSENSSGGGGEAYDQSLNTTDDVKFASLEVGGEMPKGTLSSPPAGLLKGDVWADTTDSAAHPILRVMS